MISDLINLDFGFLPLFGSIVSGSLAAILGSSAQRKAAETAAQAQRDVNALQIEFQKQLLGADGKPVFLPWYAQAQEQKMFKDATAAYDAAIAAGGTPAEAAAQPQAIADQYSQFLSQGVSEIMGGDYLAKELEAEAPVAEARTALAAGQKQSVMDALAQRLNQIKAENARAGFTGGGTFATNRALGATIGARQEAANVTGQARLANALASQKIRSDAAKLRMQTQFGAPGYAQELITLKSLPATSASQRFNQAAAIFTPFRRPQSGPLAINPPPTSVVPSPWQALASAAAQTGSTALDYYLKNQSAKALTSSAAAGAGTSLGATTLYDTAGSLEYLA